jgi:dTDP-4-dehydrorhamnose reductase
MGIPMIEKQEWLIFGGTGQLGRAVQMELSRRDIKFKALSSGQLDIRDYPRIQRYILENRPNVVLNCAGWTNVPGAEKSEELANQLNGWAVENMAKVAREVSAIFIHISSDYVFSGNQKQPYLEDDRVEPVNAYGRSKVLGETLLSELDYADIYIFRTAWLFSEYGNNFVKKILRKYINGDFPLKIVNDQFGNPTSAKDLAFQITESLMAQIPFGIFHAVNQGRASWFDLAEYSLNELGLDPSKIVGVPSADLRENFARPVDSTLNTSKWEKCGVSEMRHWKLALRDTISGTYLATEGESQNGIRKNGN